MQVVLGQLVVVEPPVVVGPLAAAVAAVAVVVAAVIVAMLRKQNERTCKVTVQLGTADTSRIVNFFLN